MSLFGGMLIGNPQDEQYYEEYKKVCLEVLCCHAFPIVYNVNFGHAAPRAALPYGAKARVDAGIQLISFA